MNFTDETIQKSLTFFLTRLTSQDPGGDQTYSIAKGHAGNIARSMIGSASQWDRGCRFNIAHIGVSFAECLESFNKDPDVGKFKLIVVMMFRFVVEQTIALLPEQEKIYISDAYDFIKGNRSWFSGFDNQIEYALQEMPLSIFKHYFYVDQPPILVDLKTNILIGDRKHVEWQACLTEAEQRVKKLSDALIGMRGEANFGVLTNAFADLKDRKVKEKDNSFKLLRAIACGLVVLLLIEIICVWIWFDESKMIKHILIAGLSVTVFGLLTYYFRIVLHNFKSIQSQILQIDLRTALCQFVENYSEFAKGVKGEKNEILARFESVVFANIVPDGSQIPALHDGVAEVTSFVKTAQGPTK